MLEDQVDWLISKFPSLQKMSHLMWKEVEDTLQLKNTEEVLYEDDEMLVINKPNGLVVHPAPGNWTATLVPWFLNSTRIHKTTQSQIHIGFLLKFSAWFFFVWIFFGDIPTCMYQLIIDRYKVWCPVDWCTRDQKHGHCSNGRRGDFLVSCSHLFCLAFFSPVSLFFLVCFFLLCSDF